MISERCVDGVDNVLIQSLELFDWDENGAFFNGSQGITFRDVFGDGNLNSEYAVFPVHGNNVLVEATEVVNVADAGIYVGQSTNITVRYNRTTNNVAGIEIENSAFANVHDNYTANNTGGLLVFKLPGPPIQLSNDHVIVHNWSENNNTPNFGAPGSTVGLIPDGTGMFVLSNDTSRFEYNYMSGNNTFGFVLIDQEGVNALVGAPVFDPPSPDQKVEDNDIRFNYVDGNGSSPDNTPPNNSPLGGDIVFFLDEDTNHNNCFVGNDDGVNGTQLLTPSDCTP
jgi:parallel beta-helix repeat protein